MSFTQPSEAATAALSGESRTVRPENSMLDGAVTPTFFRYGVPWTLGFLLMSSAGLVDAVFIGRYAGAAALGAVNVVAPLLSFYFALGIMLAVGGAVRSARYLGEGSPRAASAMFTRSMMLVLAVSTALCGAMLAGADRLVLLLGARGDMIEPGLAYLRTLMAFGPVLTGAFALSHFVRVDQRPGLASAGLAISAGVNVVLDYLFIVRWGMGVRGAALASGIGLTCTLAIFLLHFASSRAGLSLVRHGIGWKETLRASINGGAECINEVSIGIVMLLLNLMMVQHLGTAGVAAFSVVNYASWFGLTLAFGFSDSLAPLISANYGARRPGRVRGFLRTGLGTLLGIGLFMFAVFALAPNAIADLFLPGDARVAAVAVDFMSIYKWSFLCSGLNMGLICYFTGLHRTAQASGLALLRGLLLPVLCLALLPRLWGVFGIYAAIPLAEILTLGAALFLFFRGRQRMGM